MFELFKLVKHFDFRLESARQRIQYCQKNAAVVRKHFLQHFKPNPAMGSEDRSSGMHFHDGRELHGQPPCRNVGKRLRGKGGVGSESFCDVGAFQSLEDVHFSLEADEVSPLWLSTAGGRVRWRPGQVAALEKSLASQLCSKLATAVSLDPPAF